MEKKKKVLVAMSGGVDSSVAAYLLKKEGHEVGGATIRTWASGSCAEKNTKACCGVIGVEDSRKVSWKLEIPYYVFNFEQEFKKHVVDYFSAEYRLGRTPNPCIACNEHIKFKLFLKRALALGYDAIATGHHARLRFDAEKNRHLISAGADQRKDQSYVLFPLGQEVLSKLLLPVGDYTKAEIRSFARELNLNVADKPDSQEICFIPSNDYASFLEREDAIASKPGPIVDLQGTVLGRHDGYHRFTIGQRKGIGIAHAFALYVIDIVPETSTVIVGPKEAVRNRGCIVNRINWSVPVPECEKMRLQVKIRSRHEKAWAELERRNDHEWLVWFDEPQEAVTPGQACVFYDGVHVVGGGWIQKASEFALAEA